MSLDAAQDVFREAPGTQTGKAYAAELLDYFGDNMIGAGTFRQGLVEIVRRLGGMVDDFGSPIILEAKPAPWRKEEG